MDDRILTLRLLGGFDAEVDGRRVPPARWERKSAVDLVKLLALAPRHRLVRDQVADALWPAFDAVAGATNTRRAAYFARRAIGAEDAVVISAGTVGLAPHWHVVTDVEAFEAAAEEALRDGAADALNRAAALYPGDLLPEDLYEEWCAADRDRLRRTYLEVLAADGQFERLVTVEPTYEPGHQAIMRSRLDAGDRGGAIRQFEALKSALDDLGLTPAAASVALYERALDHGEADAPTPRERARTLLAWAIVHWERSDLGEAERAAVAVKALAVDAGLGREYVEATELLGLVAYAQGAWREHFGDAVVEAIQRTPEMAPFVFDAHVCLSEFFLHQPDGASAAGLLSARILRAAERAGSVGGRALALLLEGEAGLLAGNDNSRARDLLAESLRLHDEAGRTSGSCVAAERLAEALDREDQRDQAARLRSRALELATGSPMSGHLVPFVYGGMVQASSPAEVPGLLRAAAAASMGLRVCETCSMTLHVYAVPALARQGDLAGAREHLSMAERTASRWTRGNDWTPRVAESRAALRRSELETMQAARPSQLS